MLMNGGGGTAQTEASIAEARARIAREREEAATVAIARSRDRGESWEKLLTNAWMRGVAVNPANPDIIYATSSQNTCCGAPPEGSLGVVRSIDGGATWTQVNEGLPWPFAWPIALDPADPSVVYIGSPGTGFYRRRFEDPR